jgi:hypothetical protein
LTIDQGDAELLGHFVAAVGFYPLNHVGLGADEVGVAAGESAKEDVIAPHLVETFDQHVGGEGGETTTDDRATGEGEAADSEGGGDQSVVCRRMWRGDWRVAQSAPVGRSLWGRQI